ncbi:pyridoxal phosphate-dependent aminotransferase [Mycobacterium sp.]|uniref:pyridoxal phosphate-dependent aminotransferase n=1 Tax=Mycobacterium sp. TaxID=1785 RepID=UPI0025F1FCC9|nr:pyridoxal phosphate-dependent aminotransferase [Mycobacterium sp.]MBW0013683.1 pyridoxal phosphate-dependent aminotransferase [Mycobacterium sp.]
MFADRIPGDLSPNRLALAVRQRRATGNPIIDLTESNPTRVGLDYPADLLAPLADHRGLLYAPEPLGLLDARRAIAADYGRRGSSISPQRIALTASTSEAYSALFKLLARPGDEVLVPRPSYPLFGMLTTLDGVVPRPYDLEYLSYHGGWTVDFASVERALSPRTRALLVVDPNNPTGSFMSGAEIDRMAAIGSERGFALIVDEVFADYELAPGSTGSRPSVLSRSDAMVFALGGLSKSIGLPQVKLAWIAAAGPPQLVAESLERLEMICDTYLSVSTPVQLAAAELIERGAAIRAQISARTRTNYRRLQEAAAAVPSCDLLNSCGGWNAVIQVPTLCSEEELVLMLLRAEGVLAHPGYFFDFPRESFVIVSLLVAEAVFAAGIERLFGRFAG